MNARRSAFEGAFALNAFADQEAVSSILIVPKMKRKVIKAQDLSNIRSLISTPHTKVGLCRGKLFG